MFDHVAEKKSVVESFSHLRRYNVIPLVLLGPRGVGKTTFVSSLLHNEYYGLVHDLNLPLFNRDICVRIFEGDKDLGETRPRSFIIFFDLTIKVSVPPLFSRTAVHKALV